MVNIYPHWIKSVKNMRYFLESIFISENDEKSISTQSVPQCRQAKTSEMCVQIAWTGCSSSPS